jgi:hypothetical protein
MRAWLQGVAAAMVGVRARAGAGVLEDEQRPPSLPRELSPPPMDG